MAVGGLVTISPSPWAGTFAELSPPYSTIVADPPWRLPSAAATKVNAERHYSTMELADICGLPVAGIAAPNAHLWLWAINSLMEEAHQVVRAWGFRPTTIVTWCKSQPGVGHYLRNNTEHAIFATRGRPMTPKTKPLATWYRWPRGRHSAKPDAFGDLVERVSPGPYVELFCRRPRFGWDSWGLGYELGEAAS